ncbi:MAG: ABC transporter substrate-binding protein [Desulfovibrio sp.]|nr:ABC transporter substrate-binding protein [Desulfovibrio sp.]MBI4959529.1 ABC transporter substrate-binding protein [Desulfovibrio sp.]
MATSVKLMPLTEELPPFNFMTQDGARGISTDILRLMIEHSGLEDQTEEIQVQPWARAYNTVRNKPCTMLFSVTRTPERDPLFKWVGPIISNRNSLIARKDKHIRLHSVEDAQKHTLGAIRDYAPTQLLLSGGYPADKIETTPDAKSNLIKLEKGRIDLFVYNEVAFQWMVAKHGLNKNDFETVFVLHEGQLYYAFNKDTPDSIIAKLQSALDSLKKSGDVQRVIDAYLK